MSHLLKIQSCLEPFNQSGSQWSAARTQCLDLSWRRFSNRTNHRLHFPMINKSDRRDMGTRLHDLTNAHKDKRDRVHRVPTGPACPIRVLYCARTIRAVWLLCSYCAVCQNLLCIFLCIKICGKELPHLTPVCQSRIFASHLSELQWPCVFFICKATTI